MPDVIVVGGGIIGCACARELAIRGASVILLERHELAAGASGRNHGLLLSPLDPVLVPMAQVSTNAYEELAQGDPPIPFHLDPEPIGFLVVAGPDAGELEAGRLEAESASACGVAVEHIEGEALSDLEPSLSPDLAGGWLLDDGRRLDPAALTVSLGLAARARGSEVRIGTPVRAVALSRDRVRGVVTDQGRVDADTVVVAAGPWTATLLRPLGIDLPVVGARGWLVSLRPEGPSLTRLVNRAGWHMLGEDSGLPAQRADGVAGAYPEADVGTLLQPNSDGSVLAGGSRQPIVTPEPEDPSVPREILRRAIAIVPSLTGAAVLSAWWGIRPMTPDGRPIVGGVGEGLVVATGHGGQGVILGGGTADLVASMVLGTEPRLDPTPVSPERFL